MGVVWRLLFDRRTRVAFWLVRHLPPARWLAAALLVSRVQQQLTEAVCESVDLPDEACRQFSRRLLRSKTVRKLRRRARRTVRGALRHL